MQGKVTNLRTRLRFIAGIVLLAGLGSGLLLYLTAKNDEANVLGYEEGSGYVYPITPETSKKYMHDLELYGGKANVLANELMTWFAGLWHGKSLAFTVACIAFLVSLGIFLAANHLPSDEGNDLHSEDKRG